MSQDRFTPTLSGELTGLEKIIREFARNPAGPAYGELLKWATGYVGSSSRGALTKDEIEAIAAVAVHYAAPDLMDPAQTLADRGMALVRNCDLGIVFVRTVERFRKASKRDSSHGAALKDYGDNPQYSPWRESQEAAQIQKLYSQAIPDIIYPTFREALELLSAKDHDLLVKEYGFEEEGIELKRREAPVFHSESARMVALYRARKRWAEQALSLLEFEREKASRRERRALELAISELEGGKISARDKRVITPRVQAGGAGPDVAEHSHHAVEHETPKDRERAANWRAVIQRLAGSWTSFPSAEELRKGMGDDLLREPL